MWAVGLEVWKMISEPVIRQRRDYLRLFYDWISWLFEGLFDEVVQLIAAWYFASFLTPDMASKNDARHDIDYSVLG